MKAVNGLRVRGIPPVLALTLLLNPLALGAPQEPATAPAADSQLQNSHPPLSTPPPDRNSPVSPSTTSPATNSQSGDQLPDSPGALQAQSEQITQQPPQPQEKQQPQPEPPHRIHEPVGTAAAESVPTSGVAASRPTGAALAPAKQRRIRSILIRTGALVGVGVAVGATMALSQASPSKPPGSH